MAMVGFDSKWQEFPDYILGITKEIWENRGLITLHNYYSPDIIVRTPLSITKGNEQVISATMGTLAEFPNRTLLGEDVIWSGTPEQGMLSSHRIISTATHTNDGVFGKATNKTLKFRIIADCHAINNQINDEWMIRDIAAISNQLGMTSEEYARQQIEIEGGVEQCSYPFTPQVDIQGPYLGVGNDDEYGQRYEDILRRVMSAEFSVIPKEYDRACIGEYTGGQTALSHNEIDQFWMSLRSSFPNAEFKIHHRIGRNDEMMSPRAAIRWSLQGKHEGYGMFGKPTGKDVYIMGISHAEFGPWGLRREFTLLDESAVWKQILIQIG
ncbi:nuclear transport factor 2 family protein [Vibrio sp. 10N.261.46.E12]|uniref:nuclear transport factor 2 family protein n=1 Tax=unclassified Vibrio TaxID=2614977 RepID=UPI0009760D2F|nr:MULTISPECIES: polyketide cyclase [unclassified Vibrio]OMO32052.1 polyketide cyclase [Vibrio sp. 10N.261.45.E1]PMJ23572.1 polyketide cyclase [Vibrio sp. 10N.286.45.B6]PML84890.1 polyketide cyclase [Vibrio sp. 10N.261.49.E11]PMM65355.1 polyketide cyclase [Vibrio sp. 10N.261.46.F12]PMM90411.1 polyketide cyclase [Vibrio sp. 10N.261.46.E8]